MAEINFEGVLVGAVIGLTIKSFFDRLSSARKLNRSREVVLAFSEHIGLEKSTRYVHDMDFIQANVEADTEELITELQRQNYNVDYMPMFTSEIIKSFSQSELRQIAYSTQTYLDILDINYSIDFLREHMPLKLWTDFRLKLRQHMEEKKVEDEVEHLKTCGYLKGLASEILNEIEAKRQRATSMNEQFQNLIHNIKGNRVIWVIKYFLRQ